MTAERDSMTLNEVAVPALGNSWGKEQSRKSQRYRCVANRLNSALRDSNEAPQPKPRNEMTADPLKQFGTELSRTGIRLYHADH